MCEKRCYNYGHREGDHIFVRILDPNRKKYQRSFKEKHCPFCGTDEVIECEGLASLCWRVLVNKYPYMDGNVMLVPRRHVVTTDDVTGEEWLEFGKVLSRTQKVLGKAFEVDSFNIGLNVGPESGASIQHLHWQLIPRKFKNITVANTFADLHIVAVTPDETQQRIEEVLRDY